MKFRILLITLFIHISLIFPAVISAQPSGSTILSDEDKKAFDLFLQCCPGTSCPLNDVKWRLAQRDENFDAQTYFADQVRQGTFSCKSKSKNNLS